MNRIRFSLCLLAAAMAFPAAFMSAQQTKDLFELLRTDLKTQKAALITATMEFTEQESEVFWPIYREYELELSKLGDARIALVKEFADNYAAMTNEKAGELAEKSFDLQEERTSLLEKYYKRLAKALSPKTAARFAQVENQINLLIDTQIAQSIPLIK